MATFPGASVDLIPAAKTQEKIRPMMVILHTHVGPKRGGFIKPNTEKDYHFDIAVGGSVRQYIPTNVRADCNFRANAFSRGDERLGAISIETGDRFHDGDADLAKTWSDLGQFDAVVDVVTWACRTHGIPAAECRSWDQPGIGYHSMWGVNSRGSGAGKFGRYDVPKSFGGGTARLNNPWTSALGKTCPGAGKISEFPKVLAAVQTRLGGPAPEPTADTTLTVTMGTTTVQPGEGWFQVAARTLGDGSRFRELQDLNGGDRTLHPGEVLRLPGSTSAPKTSEQRTITVLAGEGWFRVAVRAFGDGSRFKELQALNGGDHTLHPGEVLVLPG